MTNLLPRDHERLQGVHPHLVRVVIEVRKAAPFIVLEVLRSRERQDAAISRDSLPLALRGFRLVERV